MMRGSLLRATGAALCWLLSPTVAHPSLLVVPDQYPTIQSALTAAISGDSIQVRPGTYVEALSLAGKDVTLFGEADSGSTVVTTQSTSRIFDIGLGVTAQTTISELMFREGLAPRGGAIQCTDGASPVFRGCEFVANMARSPDSCSYGGALFVDAGSVVTIEDCPLRAQRRAAQHPGQLRRQRRRDLRLERRARGREALPFRRQRRRGLRGRLGRRGHPDAGHRPIRGLRVPGQTRRSAQEARSWLVPDLTVERCTFASNWGGAIAIAEHYVPYCSVFEFASGPSRIEHCVFVDNRYWGTLALDGHGSILRNTLVLNQSAGISGGRRRQRWDHNIVAQNAGIGIYCYEPGP
jgi:hypothetical protein